MERAGIRPLTARTTQTYRIVRSAEKLVENGWTPVADKPGVFEKDGATVTLLEEVMISSEEDVYPFATRNEWFAEALHGLEALANGLRDGAKEASSWAGKNLRRGATPEIRSRASQVFNSVSKGWLGKNSRALPMLEAVAIQATAVAGVLMVDSYKEEGHLTDGEAVFKTITAVAFMLGTAEALGGPLCAAGASTGPGDLAICPASLFVTGLMGLKAGEAVGDAGISLNRQVNGE